MNTLTPNFAEGFIPEPHIHAQDCWRHTRSSECMQWQIEKDEGDKFDLRVQLSKEQLIIREIVGRLQKMDSEIDKLLNGFVKK